MIIQAMDNSQTSASKIISKTDNPYVINVDIELNQGNDVEDIWFGVADH